MRHAFYAATISKRLDLEPKLWLPTPGIQLSEKVPVSSQGSSTRLLNNAHNASQHWRLCVKITHTHTQTTRRCACQELREIRARRPPRTECRDSSPCAHSSHVFLFPALGGGRQCGQGGSGVTVTQEGVWEKSCSGSDICPSRGFLLLVWLKKTKQRQMPRYSLAHSSGTDRCAAMGPQLGPLGTDIGKGAPPHPSFIQ